MGRRLPCACPFQGVVLRPSSILVLGICLLGLTACASVPGPPPPPAGERMAVERKAPGGINRRQYFDEKRGRFYYFDTKRGAYFWENGQPKT